jgi:hypothetical protein
MYQWARLFVEVYKRGSQGRSNITRFIEAKRFGGDSGVKRLIRHLGRKIEHPNAIKGANSGGERSKQRRMRQSCKSGNIEELLLLTRWFHQLERHMLEGNILGKRLRLENTSRIGAQQSVQEVLTVNNHAFKLLPERR